MKLFIMKPIALTAAIFSAGILAPVTSFALAAEASDLQTVGYYNRGFSRYLPKLYGYHKPRHHYKRGYRNNRYYRPHRYNHRYGYRHSYRHGYRGYR